MTASASAASPDLSPWRLSVAPMMDWTDRNCRFLHRLLTRHTRLYTEMVTTGALLHGDQPRHLDFNVEEHPVALQLGGSEPADLAACAKLAESWGYDEVNLNCGCPSERVQRGAFGACLMLEPALVAEGIKAMHDAVSIPVTIKHRIGVDRTESYEFLRDFVGVIADAGCEVFIVHARNAWLQGISPKENRELPPLRYQMVHRLKTEFPHLTIVLNGGIKSDAEIAAQLEHVDGVMVGRQAYHEPWQMSGWDSRFFGQADPVQSREQLETLWLDHVERQVAAGRPWSQSMRHALGLWNGQPGARRWRQVWSDHKLKDLSPHQVAELATLARTEIAAARIESPPGHPVASSF